MEYTPPIYVHSNTSPTYQVQVFHNTIYDIENIKKCIEHGFLSKATIPKGKYTLTVYDIGDDGFNIFILGPEDIEEHLKLDPFDAVATIEKFLS